MFGGPSRDVARVGSRALAENPRELERGAPPGLPVIVAAVAWTLLTNDDGPDSPALVPFARALGELRDVRIVVPDSERSWVGKAITRFDPVHVEEVRRDGLDVWLCSGYPADGVQLAIDGLFESAPDLVVSGINVGYNHGAGYIMSSGTVGAAVEAWVSGVPSMAFSTGTMGDWASWRAYVRTKEAVGQWHRLAVLGAALAGEIENSTLLADADVVSVNMPFEADEKTPRRLTSIARVGYDRLFRPDGERRFVHAFGGAFREFDELHGTDVDAAHHGWVSITPIRMPQAASVEDRVRRSLER